MVGQVLWTVARKPKLFHERQTFHTTEIPDNFVNNANTNSHQNGVVRTVLSGIDLTAKIATTDDSDLTRTSYTTW